MEIQKNSNSQSNLEKEEWNWMNQPAWLQAILQSHSHQDSMVLAQRQKYRSMEHNRKPRDKSTNLRTPYLQQRRQEYTMEKRQPLLKVVLRKLVNHLFSSVQFSRSVMSNSLRPHKLQHARPPCPSPTPGIYSNSCPSSQWCHPAISSSVVPFSSCPQSLPRSGSFPMSQLFEWGGQSFSFSIIPSNEHPGLISFRMDWLDLLEVQGTLMSFLQHLSSKASIIQSSAFFIVQLSHPYMTTGKTLYT